MSVLHGHMHPAPVARTPGRRPVGRTMRRLGLGVFFGSVAVNAALGILALVSPDWSETQGKILGTSLCVTGAVLVVLACEPAWERRRLGPIPWAGMLLGAVGFGLAIGAIWAEPSADVYGKLVGTALAVTAGCVVASLLALVRLARPHRWAFLATLALLAAGTAMFAGLFWLEGDPSETYLRAQGVVLVLLAAFVVTVPVLHWVDRGAVATAEARTADAVRFCPLCGARMTGGIGAELECPGCGREFSVACPSTDLT